MTPNEFPRLSAVLFPFIMACHEAIPEEVCLAEAQEVVSGIRGKVVGGNDDCVELELTGGSESVDASMQCIFEDEESGEMWFADEPTLTSEATFWVCGINDNPDMSSVRTPDVYCVEMWGDRCWAEIELESTP